MIHRAPKSVQLAALAAWLLFNIYPGGVSMGLISIRSFEWDGVTDNRHEDRLPNGDPIQIRLWIERL